MNNTRLIALCPDCGHFQSIHEDWRPCLGHTDVVFDCLHCGMILRQTVAEATVGNPRLMAAAPEMLDMRINNPIAGPKLEATLLRTLRSVADHKVSVTQAFDDLSGVISDAFDEA